MMPPLEVSLWGLISTAGGPVPTLPMELSTPIGLIPHVFPIRINQQDQVPVQTPIVVRGGKGPALAPRPRVGWSA
jgi:hypothetical protein